MTSNKFQYFFSLRITYKYKRDRSLAFNVRHYFVFLVSFFTFYRETEKNEMRKDAPQMQKKWLLYERNEEKTPRNEERKTHL